MNYQRLRKANLLAKKRFKRWYSDLNVNQEDARFGKLRKTNTVCSCQMCRNPRHSVFYSEQEKLTRQERRAPQIQDNWD